MPELKLGYQGPLYNPWYDWAFKYAASYNFMLGKRDGYFGDQEDAFVREMQRRLGIVIDGVFGDRTAAKVGYKWPGTSAPPVVVARRKIWIFTHPGSGANWDQGPSFDLGVKCKDDLNLNHQPVYFQKGGYLGALGGDPKFSYNEVIWDQHKSDLWLMDNNADAQEAMQQARALVPTLFPGKSEEQLNDADLVVLASKLEFEHHRSGYSQSAQGVEESCEVMYGDGGFVHPGDPTQTPSAPGPYRLIRHTLKLLVQFGNPSTAVTGIARKVRSAWLAAKVRNINYSNDFYAVVPASDKIRPAFYAIIVESEMELPFFVHVLRVAVPIISAWAATALPIIGPMLGGFGPMVQLALGMINGLQGLGNNPLLGNLMGQADSDRDRKVDDDLIALLTPTGLLSNIGGLIGLIAALPGLDAHGRYPFDPVMMDRAYDHIASFRR